MKGSDSRDDSPDEGDGERLRASIATDRLPVALVSSFAGDRAMTETESHRIQYLKAKRGNLFYSDLLYAISHHYFAPEIAENVWNKVVVHKSMMSEKLARNVSITVATLDYLSNIISELGTFTLMSEAHIAEIVNLSMRDGLTGLFNHSTFYELLELELRNHKRYGVGVALILLDIDDFKLVNDRWGHQEGDRVLFELATTINNETRDSDICCRFGGEEFAIILPFTDDLNEALKIAERIRAGAAKIVSNGRTIAVSAGVALCDQSTKTSRALVDGADRALYQAKRSGKNKVVVSSLCSKP